MLGQTAAMLVALATLIAANLHSVALLAILGKGLAVAGTSCASLLELGGSLVGRDVVRIVIDGTPVESSLHIDNRLVGR